MAKINFPPNPDPEDTFTDSGTGQLFVYNGEGWVRTKQGSGIPEPLGEGVQYARIVDTQGLPGRWEKVATDIWYLGAFTAHPYFDHEGNPVVKGQVYFNLIEEINYSYTGTEWAAFADIMYVFGLQTYTYVATAGQTIFTGPDNYGNSPADWIDGETIVAVHVEGVQHSENVGGGTVPIGTYTVDYAGHSITFDSGLTLDDEVGITTYLSMPGDDASLYAFVIDEDNMISDSDTKVPTQQSVKAYVDAVTDDAFSRNLVVNPNFEIQEREYSTYRLCDRWAIKYNFSLNGSYTLNQDSDGYYARLSQTTSGSMSPGFIYVLPLSEFTSNEQVTLSVTHYEDNAIMPNNGTCAINIRIFPEEGSTGYVEHDNVATLTVASTWSREGVTFNIPDFSGLTIIGDAGIAFEIDVGTRPYQHYFRDFQIERGGIQTSFTSSTYEGELKKCLSYYTHLNSVYVLPVDGTHNRRTLNITLPAVMRKMPDPVPLPSAATGGVITLSRHRYYADVTTGASTADIAMILPPIIDAEVTGF